MQRMFTEQTHLPWQVYSGAFGKSEQLELYFRGRPRHCWLAQFSRATFCCHQLVKLFCYRLLSHAVVPAAIAIATCRIWARPVLTIAIPHSPYTCLQNACLSTRRYCSRLKRSACMCKPSCATLIRKHGIRKPQLQMMLGKELSAHACPRAACQFGSSRS
jgi:hypothetical protein